MSVNILLGKQLSRYINVLYSELIQLAIKFVLNIVLLDSHTVIVQGLLLQYGELLFQLSHVRHTLKVISNVVINYLKSSAMTLLFLFFLINSVGL